MSGTLLKTLAIISLFNFLVSADANKQMREDFAMERLAQLPSNPRGAFMGDHNGVVILAGGADVSIEDALIAKPGRYFDDIFVLRKDASGQTLWVQADIKLPAAMAFGVAVSTPAGLLCAGGFDGAGCSAQTLLLKWDAKSEKITIERLPDLPYPSAFAVGGVIGETVYVAGGKKSIADAQWTKDLLSLKIGKDDRWQVVSEIPAAGRFIASGVQSDGERKCLYLFGDSGSCSYEPLKGKWRPAAGFSELTGDAASKGSFSAASYGEYFILLAGSVDALPTSLFGYHTITNRWVEIDASLDEVADVGGIFHYGTSFVLAHGVDSPQGSALGFIRLIPEMDKRYFGAVNWVVLIVYLLLLVWMGYYFSNKEKTTGDFFLAGGRIPWWAAGLSIYGTQLSAITFMAIPATTYRLNWLTYVSGLMIFIVTPIVVYVYLPFYRRLSVTTAYEYLEKRFNLAARLYCSSMFIIIQMARMGVVLLLPSLALSAVTGIDKYTCILVMGVLCTFYTVMGGIEAVIWTDVVQVLVLLGGALLSLVYIISDVDGGIATVFKVASAEGKLKMVDLGWDYAQMSLWVIIIGNILQNLVPYTADQTVVQRYLTTPTEKAARKAIWTGALITAPSAILFFSIGTALFVFYKSNPHLLEPMLQNDAIFPLFIHEKLPVGVAGLLIAGVFAAAMSSLDSSMNSIATAVTTDFYKRFINVQANDEKCLRLAKIITVVLGVLGTGIAILLAAQGGQIKSLWFMTTRILGLFGGGMAGMFVLAIFTRNTTSRGVLAGAIIAAAVQFYVAFNTNVHFYLYAGIGIVVCFVAGYVMSFILGGSKGNVHGNTIYTIRKTLDT